MALTLVPFDQLAALLDLQGDSYDDYPALEFIADGVQAALENYTGRALESKERTETVRLTVDGTRQVPLKALPVTSLGVVTVDGETEDDAEITGYGIRLPAAVAGATVEVTYTGGFTDATIPADIPRAAVYQAAYEWQSRDHVGAQSVNTDGGSVSRPALGLLSHVRAQLDAHRHPMRAVAI